MTPKFHQAFDALPNTIKDLVRESVRDLSPQKVLLFGSRARGNHRENSDFDICLVGAINDAVARSRFQVKMEEEAITLHKVDLVFLENLNQEYQKNIGIEGKLLYGN